MIQSFTSVPLAPPCRSLQEVWDSYDDQTVWERFSCDGDGTWILHALLRGSLVIVHHDSYMPFVSSAACSCGFLLYCSSSDNRAEGSFAERSDDSDNYRGEWLGCIGALQVLLPVISTNDLTLDSIPPVHAHTDNMGVVVTHNRHLHWSLSDTQPQADLKRVGKEYRRRIPFCVAYHHVDEHLDRLLRWDQLTRSQQENCRMDVLAKSTLLSHDRWQQGHGIVFVCNWFSLGV